jgi:hypothetical protein
MKVAAADGVIAVSPTVLERPSSADTEAELIPFERLLAG